MPSAFIEVSKDFPQGMPRKQLQTAVDSYLSKVRESGSQENVVMQCYPLIALGLNELQARENKLIMWISIFIGAVSMIVAGVALCISVNGARSSDDSSTRQIALIEALNKNVLESQRVIKETLVKSQAAVPQQKAANPAVKRDAPKAARHLP